MRVGLRDLATRVTIGTTALLCVAALIICGRAINSAAHADEEDDSLYVIIDAGHGGFDCGAVAPDGTEEKDINLAIALYLKECCARLGFKTLMTRTSDISTMDVNASEHKKQSDLNNRLKLMKSKQNCIFVSIHQNEFSTPSPHGAQVFYAKTEGSEALAVSLQKRLTAMLDPENKREISADNGNVFLLQKAVCPAVIVECGFISNPDELSKLKSEEYQRQVAFAILAGICDYCGL